MRFRALALCVAGVVATGVAARADHEPGHKNGRHNDRQMNGRMSAEMERELAIDPVTGYSLYSGGWIYDRQVLFAEVPPKREVAAKVSDLIQAQRHEAAMLTALMPRARTAGFTNVMTVYDRMAAEHMQLADFAANWLTQNGYPVPAAPEAVAVSDMSAEASVDQQMQMHQEMFNKMIEARKGERSSTVRTMELWAAAGAARHMSLLSTLDQDIEIGRKSLSARLEAQLNQTIVASNSEMMTRIVEEQRIYFQSLNPPPPPYVPPVQVAVQPPAPAPEVPRAAPPPATPAPPVAERPAPPETPRVAAAPPARPAYRPPARVAGRRQIRRRRAAH